MFPDYSPVSLPRVNFIMLHCQTYSADTTWSATLFRNVFKYTKKEKKSKLTVCTLTPSFQSYVNCAKKKKKKVSFYRVTYSTLLSFVVLLYPIIVKASLYRRCIPQGLKAWVIIVFYAVIFTQQEPDLLENVPSFFSCHFIGKFLSFVNLLTRSWF